MRPPDVALADQPGLNNGRPRSPCRGRRDGYRRHRTPWYLASRPARPRSERASHAPHRRRPRRVSIQRVTGRRLLHRLGPALEVIGVHATILSEDPVTNGSMVADAATASTRMTSTDPAFKWMPHESQSLMLKLSAALSLVLSVAVPSSTRGRQYDRPQEGRRSRLAPHHVHNEVSP